MILSDVEKAARDPELKAELDEKNGTILFRINLGHCVYGVLRMTAEKQARLSRRQKEIADLFLTGLPRRKIATKLHISPRTVDTHIERLFIKFNVDTRIGLAKAMLMLS